MLTLREPFAPGLWAEAGAMRIPRSHALTHALIDRYGLATQPFTMDNPRGVLLLRRAARASPRARRRPARARLRDRARTSACRRRSCGARELEPFVGPPRTTHGDDAWAAIAAEYDQYCVREFLELRGWSEGAIEMFGLLFNQEALMNSSFLELLREELGGFYTDLVYLDGGTDLLPRAFLPELASRIRFGAKVVAIDQSDDDVTVHCRNAGNRFAVDRRLRGAHRAVPGAAPRRGAHAVLAAQAARHPPAPLRRVGEGVPAVPAAVLGGGRRHRRRRHASPTSRCATSTTPTTAATPAAA